LIRRRTATVGVTSANLVGGLSNVLDLCDSLTRKEEPARAVLTADAVARMHAHCLSCAPARLELADRDPRG